MLGHLLLGWRAGLELIIHFSPGIFILSVVAILFLIPLALVNLGRSDNLAGSEGEPSSSLKKQPSSQENGPDKIRGQQVRVPLGSPSTWLEGDRSQWGRSTGPPLQGPCSCSGTVLAVWWGHLPESGRRGLCSPLYSRLPLPLGLRASWAAALS